MRHTTIIYALALLAAFSLSSCLKDKTQDKAEQSDKSIELSGMMTRNDGINGANLYLKAFLGAGGSQGAYPYFGETLFTVPGGLTNQEKTLVFPTVAPYYPLGTQSISLYAFSGKLDEDRMVLRAGHGASFDAVLSNQGYTGDILSGEGQGTVGSSFEPAQTMLFRHVMTKVTVTVAVDENENPPVDPAPQIVQFTMNGVAARGLYAIRAFSTETATDTQGSYTLSLGDNYLIPNGSVLSGARLTHLRIDDYTATAADLAAFTVEPEGGNSNDFILLPGYAYEFELLVQKLRVTGVTVRMIPWNRTELNGDDVTADTYPLTLSLGEYQNTGADEVTKVVLHTNNDRIYVGETQAGQNTVEFVRLPASGTVTQAELYTDTGLLLQTVTLSPAAYEFASDAGQLNISVSLGGMVTEDGLPYSETNPYLVATPLQLRNISKEPALNYRQAANLDMDATNGNFAGIQGFTGVYDGNGFMIYNLQVNGPGLFNTNGGTLQHIRIFSGTIDAAGQSYAGALCGINNGVIVACANSAQVMGATATAGGICGLNSPSGTVIACLNTGNVREGTNVGGIVGENQNISEGVIAACVNTGMLNGQATLLGGICGESVATQSNMARTSFWLVGSAERYVGSTEYAVGSNNTGLFDTSALDPIELRAIPSGNDTTGQLPIQRLNNELETNYPAWAAQYQFINDRETTGVTWPFPASIQ